MIEADPGITRCPKAPPDRRSGPPRGKGGPLLNLNHEPEGTGLAEQPRRIGGPVTSPYQPDATGEGHSASPAPADHTGRCHACSQPLPPDSAQARNRRARNAVFDAWKESKYAEYVGGLGPFLLMDLVDRAIDAVRDADAETDRLIGVEHTEPGSAADQVVRTIRDQGRSSIPHLRHMEHLRADWPELAAGLVRLLREHGAEIPGELERAR